MTTTPTTQQSVGGEGRGRTITSPRFFRIRDINNTPVIEVAINGLLTSSGKLRWAISTWSLKDRRKPYDRQLAQHIALSRTTMLPVRLIEPGVNLRARIIKAISLDTMVCRLAREVAIYNLSNHATARRIERILKSQDKAKRVAELKALANPPKPSTADARPQCLNFHGKYQCTLEGKHDGPCNFDPPTSIVTGAGTYTNTGHPSKSEAKRQAHHTNGEGPSASKGSPHAVETKGVATPAPGNTFPPKPLYEVKPLIITPEPADPTVKLMTPEQAMKTTCPVCRSAPDRACSTSGRMGVEGFMHRARLDPEWWKAIGTAYEDKSVVKANEGVS